MSTLSKDPEDMTDEELLERIATMDPEKYPIATHAQRALDRRQERES